MIFFKRFIILALCCYLALFSATGSALASASVQFIRDEEIEQMLKKMSKPVFDQAGLSADAIRFYIVENSELNAFVMGGQNIFINTGTIMEAENAAELMGVIAHETGHIASGHLFRLHNESENTSWNAILANLLGIAVAVGTGSAEAGMAVGSAGSTMAMRSMLRHSRTQEGSADQSGVRFLKAAGMPLTGFLSFMEKLESQELLPESQQVQYIITHPLTQDRISFLQYEVDNDKARKVSPAWEQWEEMHHRIKSKLLGYIMPMQALTLKGDSISDRYAQATAYVRKGQMDKALPLINGLLKAEPNNPYFHELAGQAFYESGQIDESIEAYSQAAKLAPFSALIKVSYAQSLLQAKASQSVRENEAIKQLNLALRQDSRMAETHHFLAIAYGRQGNEGLSALHLAEEALMQYRLDFAKNAAGRARASLEKNSPAYLRAEDIMADIDRTLKKSNKK